MKTTADVPESRHARIVLLDTRGRATPLLDAGEQGLSLSRDGRCASQRWASCTETRTEADVWLATLTPP
jgi:hypothetical protein